jgi:hypothetical protein
MELDDLKHHWKSADNIQQYKNQNIMEMIQHQSNGPVAALKRSYKRQMIAMTLVPLAIVSTNLQHIDKTLTSALFWFYILFCIAVIAFAKLNYNTVKKLEGMDIVVKSNLEAQILILEKRLRQNLIGIRIALIFFIVLTEILPYLQNFDTLNFWHSLSPFIRFGAYALLLLFQYIVSRQFSHEKFGKHIEHLKELVKSMQ